MVGAGLVGRQKPGAPSRSLCGCRIPKTWTIFHCFPKRIGRKLDQNWSSQVSNHHPYEIPEPPSQYSANPGYFFLKAQHLPSYLDKRKTCIHIFQYQYTYTHTFPSRPYKLFKIVPEMTSKFLKELLLHFLKMLTN